MLHILSLLFWLLVIPYCIGLIPAYFISADKKDPGTVLLAGYFLMWSLFEVIAIPAVLWVKYNNFTKASICFMVVSLLCAAAGLWLMRRGCRSREGRAALPDIRGLFKALSLERRVLCAVFFALLGFQLYMAVSRASFDGDDAYYVVESLIAQQADVMYRILPYTGRPTDPDIRHALAVFPMWIAYVAVKSDIHATIVSHVVMPLLLIPLSYLVYYEIGRILFCRRGEADDSVFHSENLPVFMCVMALFQIFGNVSIYTNETFFLTRTWQGKAVAGSLVIPALFWVILRIYDGAKESRKNTGLWILLTCVNTAAGLCSSIAVFLVCILMAVTALCLAVIERDGKVIVKMAAACIPNGVYMAVYVCLAYGYLLR